MTVTPGSPEYPGPNRSEAKRRGQQRLRSRRAALRRIRVRIALGAVCLFLVCWLTIFGVLVEGKDPALSASARRSEAHVRTAAKSTTLSRPQSNTAKAKAKKAEVRPTETTATETTSTEARATETTSTETAASSEEAETASENSASTSVKSSATPMTTSQS